MPLSVVQGVADVFLLRFNGSLDGCTWMLPFSMAMKMSSGDGRAQASGGELAPAPATKLPCHAYGHLAGH